MIAVDLPSRIAVVKEQLAEAATRANRDPDSVTVVAVSKTVGLAEVEIAYEAGLRHFGENRVQEARNRLQGQLPPELILHLIGQLQTNKAGHAVDLFQVIESVDRPSLVTELEKQMSRRARSMPVLVQVNVAGEEQKSGCEPTDAEELARSVVASDHLDLRGLMTIAPLVGDPEQVRPIFRGLRELRDRLEQSLGLSLPTLSMGMTNDYQVAIEEGSTHIRVGRAIFGG